METSGPRLQKYYLNSIETLPGGGGGTSIYYLGCLHLAQNSQTYIVVSRNIIEILSFLSQHKKTFFESRAAETHDKNKRMTKKLKPVNKSGFVERGYEGRSGQSGILEALSGHTGSPLCVSGDSHQRESPVVCPWKAGDVSLCGTSHRWEVVQVDGPGRSCFLSSINQAAFPRACGPGVPEEQPGREGSCGSCRPTQAT